MFEVLSESEGRRLYIKASGRLTDADYKELTPRLEAAIEEHGPLRLYVDMEKFEGWELQAAWDDFAFGIKHWNDFDRVALVGDKKWEEASVKVVDKFTKGDFRFFDVSNRSAAHDWIATGLIV
ncbi:MAG: STAS/SEC14 domain-containing protein [Proteobacteria bacterium]|nr:STAS/SEC14 domain-containing protein [Pseudomonadota bacterium]